MVKETLPSSAAGFSSATRFFFTSFAKVQYWSRKSWCPIFHLGVIEYEVVLDSPSPWVNPSLVHVWPRLSLQSTQLAGNRPHPTQPSRQHHCQCLTMLGDAGGLIACWACCCCSSCCWIAANRYNATCQCQTNASSTMCCCSIEKLRYSHPSTQHAACIGFQWCFFEMVHVIDLQFALCLYLFAAVHVECQFAIHVQSTYRCTDDVSWYKLTLYGFFHFCHIQA